MRDSRIDIDERFLETGILFDLYGNLLTEKKRTIMELYHDENLSLSEIAEEQGISRAAVHDALKSAEKSLFDYEEKLGLAEDYHERQKAVEALRGEISKLVSDTNSSKEFTYIEKLLSRLEE